LQCSVIELASFESIFVVLFGEDGVVGDFVLCDFGGVDDGIFVSVLCVFL
jgi:hypothetical protein